MSAPPSAWRALSRMARSELGQRLASGVFWSIGGAVIERLASLVTLIAVARMFGEARFGELGVIQSTVGMFGVFAGFGLGTMAAKHVAEIRAHDPERAGRIVGLSAIVAVSTGLLGSAVLVAIAPWLAGRVLAAPHLVGALRLAAPLVLFGGINGFLAGALAGFEAFRALALRSLCVGLAGSVAVVAGAAVRGVSGAVGGFVAAAVLNTLLNLRALRAVAGRAGVPLALRGSRKEAKLLWSFALPALLAAILVVPVTWACNAMLANRPGGYAELGIFNAANQWRLAVLFLPTAAGNVILPVLASLLAQGDRRRYEKVLFANLVVNGGTALVAAGVIALGSRFIMNAYGAGFRAGRLVLAVMVLSSVFAAANTVVGNAIISRGKMWVGFAFNGMWATALLVVSWQLVARGYGALGLGLAMLIAYVLHTVWQALYVWKAQ